MTPAAARTVPELDLASARLFRVLGNPTRLAIIELLLERPRTVAELIERLGCSPSRVSNHLACLRWCGFVEAERWGRTATYSILDERVTAVLVAARQMATDHCHHLASCTRIGPDWV
jgi:ArsR family transcriptional regulator, cadmium/lead-responsive transcriptional repressor